MPPSFIQLPPDHEFSDPSCSIVGVFTSLCYKYIWCWWASCINEITLFSVHTFTPSTLFLLTPVWKNLWCWPQNLNGSLYFILWFIYRHQKACNKKYICFPFSLQLWSEGTDSGGYVNCLKSKSAILDSFLYDSTSFWSHSIMHGPVYLRCIFVVLQLKKRWGVFFFFF